MKYTEKKDQKVAFTMFTVTEKTSMLILINTIVFCFFLNLIYFMRFSTSKQLHSNDHLKAHLGYKSCPRTLGTEDLVYGGTRTHDLVAESPVP